MQLLCVCSLSFQNPQLQESLFQGASRSLLGGRRQLETQYRQQLVWTGETKALIFSTNYVGCQFAFSQI